MNASKTRTSCHAVKERGATHSAKKAVSSKPDDFRWRAEGSKLIAAQLRGALYVENSMEVRYQSAVERRPCVRHALICTTAHARLSGQRLKQIVQMGRKLEVDQSNALCCKRCGPSPDGSPTWLESIASWDITRCYLDSSRFSTTSCVPELLLGNNLKLFDATKASTS